MKKQKQNNQFWRIFLLAKPFWRNIFGISLLIIVGAGIDQIFPLISKALVDLISLGKASLFLMPQPTLWGLLLIMLGLRLASTVLDRLSQYASRIMTTKLSFYLREIAFCHLMTLSVNYFNKNQSGKTMSKVGRGVEGIKSIINDIGIHFLPGLITAVFSIIIVTRYNLAIGLASMFMFVPYFFLRRMRFQATSKIEKKQNKIWDRDYSHYWEVIANIRLVKAFNSENFEKNQFRKTANKLIGNILKIEQINNLGTTADLFLDVWSWGLYGYAMYLGFKGQFTLGTIFLMTQYIEMIKRPLWSLNWIFWDIKYAQIGVKDYLKIMDEKSDLWEEPEAIDLSEIKGRIEFKNVSFKYPEKSGQKVFSNISFTVEPGQTLALVGKSGAGKTTVAHLVVRFFDPDQGQVLIDGIDVRQLSFATLRRATGLVMQDSYLFDDTIASNLRYGKPNATQAELIAACQVANAMEFIDKLPKGLNTVIGERGVKLSGGQKQRLSIARTVLKNPRILILDEATSSLDSHSEMLVQDALDKLIKGRTTIIIAHRLSTVQKADKILVLDNKKILEQGTHKQLLQTEGLYSQLYKIQSGKKLDLKDWELVA